MATTATDYIESVIVSASKARSNIAMLAILNTGLKPDDPKAYDATCKNAVDAWCLASAYRELVDVIDEAREALVELRS